MRKARVLYLDTQFKTYMAGLEMAGSLEAEVTTLDHQELVTPGGYKESQLGKDYAARATPDDYDLVVIGNNRGSGYAYARMLVAKMRSKTLIVWNDYEPGDEHGYVELGFSNFCSRRDQVQKLLEMLPAVVDLAAVQTWTEAIETFPCPKCSTDLGKLYAELSPGYVQCGHSLHSGNLCRVCGICQPAVTQTLFADSGGNVSEEVARRLVDDRYPVRYVWDWEGRLPVVRDRASGEQVWAGTPDENGFDAKAVIDRHNKEWWAGLECIPHRLFQRLKMPAKP